MKIILCSMIDNNFIIAFRGFMKSLLKSNPNFNLPVRLIDMGLNWKGREICLETYPNIEFVLPKRENYKDISFEKTKPHLQNTYYKLDIFSYTDVDRLVFIDLDTIVLQDISSLFEVEAPIAGCRAYKASADKLRGDMNTGVIVLNKENLNEKVYKDILKFTADKGGFSMPDQKAIGLFFGKVKKIDKTFNCEKRLWNGTHYKIEFLDKTLVYRRGDKIEPVKILHYVASKPWEEGADNYETGFEELEKIWWGYFNGKNINS